MTGMWGRSGCFDGLWLYGGDLYGLLPGWGRMPPFLLYTGFGWRAMRLGLIQMDVVSGDKERNITHAFELMGKVSHQADMIFIISVKMQHIWGMV